MLKTNQKKRSYRTRTNHTKAALNLAVHTDSYSHLPPILRLEPSATFSIANSTRGTHFIFGPAAGAAAVAALHLAQIETRTRIPLQQLASLATITVGNQCQDNRFAAGLPPHLAFLKLLNQQEVSAVQFNVDKTSKTDRTIQPCLPAAMYHHHSQQQGLQPFSNRPRPHHPPHSNQHQNHNSSDMMSQVMNFEFPRPTQLPDELESALAIRGARDMDHRLIDHKNSPNQHQNQGSGSGISQHGSYSSIPMTLTSDSQPGHQQGVDWSSYQPPTKLFAGPSPSATQQSQRHQPQPEGSHAGTNIPSWTAADSLSPQVQHPQGGRSVGSGDGQGLYTPESAGSILASFGLSNEDLEVLSHYPDDQLTPDTLPFILRDIQINKSGNPKSVTSTSSSSFTRGIHDMPLPPSCSSPLKRSQSPEVPSLLTVTQTAGKVIDYGHASRAKDENNTRETFKREPLSSERTVKMYQTSSLPSSTPKVDKVERRQVPLEHTEPSKHGDWDYRRTSSEHRKRSSDRELTLSSKSRNLDRDYRCERPKPRPSSEARSEDSSKQSLSSSSGSKSHNSSKKLPTPTMISDFTAVSPKVYPHTCSLCHSQCDQEKDWVDHINTVNHTAACRDLRNRYPDWKPNFQRSGRYGSQTHGNPKDHSPSKFLPRSLSSSPPLKKHKVGHQLQRQHGKPYSTHHRSRYPPYSEHSHRLELRHSGSRSPSHPRITRTSSATRDHRFERRDRESSGGSSLTGVKRSHDDPSRHPSSSKMGHNSKILKNKPKTGTKMASAKTSDKSAKPTVAKKKKKVVTMASQDLTVADRLVYLTGIPNDASEQEITDLVGSFGKINNVILLPFSEEDDGKANGQKASVCMVEAEDAQALASSTKLFIRDQQITASTAKKPDGGWSSDANHSQTTSGQEKGAATEDLGANADQKTSDEKGVLLIAGLPDNNWEDDDIIKLIQPFGSPSDLIVARQIGKVLVSVPVREIAQEMVKVHTFNPLKIKETEVKLINVNQRIGLSTPVALYNLLMGSGEPLDSSLPVGWSSLLVISNVPSTPCGSSEVQKLVRRFGTVIKTLVLNTMVICEMATAAMALSVLKRFQMFPCIIQNNPLFFSRKPDPKISTQTKVITAYLDSSEDTPEKGKSSQTAAAVDAEDTACKEKSESPLEEMEQDAAETDEKSKSAQEAVGEDNALGVNVNDSKAKLSSAVPDSLTASDIKPGAVLDTDMRETSDVKTTENTEENKEVSAPKEGKNKTPADEKTKISNSNGNTASREAIMPDHSKVGQEMVNAFLVECRTSTASQANDVAASSCQLKEETQVATEQVEKATDETKEPAKNHTEEEMKKQGVEKREREVRKEKEVRERERRPWDKEERAKRERDERAKREKEKREEERKEWERRERERRERRRGYGESSSGLRSSGRSEGYKPSSGRDAHHNTSETKMVEEEESDFPFNMSDFVTIDEVGDVTDLPDPPPGDPTVEGGDNAPTAAQQDPPHTTTEAATDTPSEDTLSPGKSNQVLECELVSAPTVKTSDQLEATVSSPGLPPPTEAAPSPASQADVSLNQTQAQCQNKAPETEPTPTAALDNIPTVEPISMTAPACLGITSDAASAESSSNSPAVGAVTAETDNSAVIHSQAKEEETVAVPGKQEPPEAEKNTEDDEKKKLQTKTPSSTDHSLPSYDPSKPVGMEFLVPKTGFFCKVCNRFFSGGKEAEINHCKSVKHYDNLQKYLQSTKTMKTAVKQDTS